LKIAIWFYVPSSLLDKRGSGVLSSALKSDL
jgi:hypothetical protein